MIPSGKINFKIAYFHHQIFADAAIFDKFDVLRLTYSDTHSYITIAGAPGLLTIVINVPTRDLLAVETKDSFVLWLAKLK